MSLESRRRVVVIAGAKGSPGCTYVAIGLARRLASGGLPTLLVDADAEERGVGALLGLASTGGSSLDRAAALTAGIEPDLLHRLAVVVRPGFAFVEAPMGDTALDGRHLVAAARDAFSAAVFDLGHLHGPLQRQLAAAADWVLWVVSPDRVGLERAERALKDRRLAGASPGLVFNRLSRHTLKGADRLLAERHRMPVMARLGGLSRAGLALPWRSQFGDLARAVHPDAPASSGRWP